MDNQEVFTTAYRHLLKQNAKSKPSDSQSCVYRGPDGLKCAVGALFPDELYHPNMDADNLTVGQLLDGYPKVAKHFEGVDETLLRKLQHIHDSDPEPNWPYALTTLARRFNLEVPVDA